MNLNIKIRKAVHEDMEKLRELDSKAFKNEAYPLSFFKQSIELFPYTFYIAELDKNLIGFCIDSNKLVLAYGIVPVIAARSNSVGDIIKTDEGDCFRGEYIPREYHRILGRIYDLRTIIERKNSNEVVGYNRSEMPTRGINWARCFVSISNITALLTALTAYKVRRYDLIRAASSFRRLEV